MTPEQDDSHLLYLSRIADQLERIADFLESVITTVNEGQTDEEHAIQTWEANDGSGEDE